MRTHIWPHGPCFIVERESMETRERDFVKLTFLALTYDSVASVALIIEPFSAIISMGKKAVACLPGIIPVPVVNQNIRVVDKFKSVFSFLIRDTNPGTRVPAGFCSSACDYSNGFFCLRHCQLPPFWYAEIARVRPVHFCIWKVVAQTVRFLRVTLATSILQMKA